MNEKKGRERVAEASGLEEWELEGLPGQLAHPMPEVVQPWSLPHPPQF